MLPAHRTEGEVFSIPQFDLTPRDVDGLVVYGIFRELFRLNFGHFWNPAISRCYKTSILSGINFAKKVIHNPHVLLLDSSLREITVSLGAGSVTVQPATGVPEPSATLLLAVSLAGVFALGWRRRQRAA